MYGHASFPLAALLLVPMGAAARNHVEICHRGAVLAVAENAAPAHLRHGDVLPQVGYIDADGDGFGAPDRPVKGCGPLRGVVPEGSDCNDVDPLIHPGARETCEAIDRDCDGVPGGVSFDAEGQLQGAECLMPDSVEAQQALWVQHGRVDAGCVWEELQVGSGADLAGRMAHAACGRVVRLEPGVFDAGQVEITAPTILVGSEGTTVVGSLMVRAGVPLRVDGVAFARSPYPGAIFASHPLADVTLRNVTISGATGYGIFQHGGVLRVYQSTISGTRAGGRRAPEGAGVIADGARVVPGPFPLFRPLVYQLLYPYANLPNAARLMAEALPPIEGNVWAIHGDLPSVGCSSAAVYLGPGTYSELVETDISDSEGAAVLADGADTHALLHLVDIDHSGYDPGPVPDIYALISPECMGAVHTRNTARLVAQTVSVVDSRYIGVLSTDGGVVLMKTSEVIRSHAVHGEIGDGYMALYGSFMNLEQCETIHADRAGILFSLSEGNLKQVLSATKTHQLYGLVLQVGSAVNYTKDSIFLGSDTDILSDGALPIPNAPLDLPDEDGIFP